MSIIERARAKNVPPSLLQENSAGRDVGFEAAVNKVMDATGTCVRPSAYRCLLLRIFVLLCALAARQTSHTAVPFYSHWIVVAELCLATGPSVADDFKALLQVR
jgi:hypothetical protein